MTPYLLLADFIATHIDPEVLANFKATEEVHDHFYDLLEKEKLGIATEAEIAEIEQFMSIEHILQLAKAKVEQHAN